MQGRYLARWGTRIGGLATVLTLLPAAAWACAVCWDGDDALARGMNSSILFLMSMPFIIFGSIFSVVYLTQKRARKQAKHELAWAQKENAQ